MRIMEEQAQVLAIIPALNEEATIGMVVEQLRRQGVRHVRVVDNASADATAGRARAAGAEVVFAPVRGYGRACLRGVEDLPPQIQWILFCDGDGSDDLDALPALLNAADHCDLLLGNRRAGASGRAAMTALQNWGNGLAVALVRWGWGIRYSDLGPLRLIRRSALERLGMQEEGCGWTVEMQVRAAEIGLRVLELSVNYRARQGGRSKISGSVRGTVRAGSAILWTLARLYLRRVLHCKPELVSATNKV